MELEARRAAAEPASLTRSLAVRSLFLPPISQLLSEAVLDPFSGSNKYTLNNKALVHVRRLSGRQG